MVALEAERRLGDRRASLHVATAADRRGKSFSRQSLNTHQAARAETMAVEIQAAQQYAEEAVVAAAASLTKFHDDLRTALAAVAAAKRAAHIVAGLVSGVES